MRRMLRSIVLVWVTALFGLASGTSSLTQATYEVTIHNLTRGQLITPPLVVVHDSSTSLFSVGQPASMELATLAEEGIPRRRWRRQWA